MRPNGNALTITRYRLVVFPIIFLFQLLAIEVCAVSPMTERSFKSTNNNSRQNIRVFVRVRPFKHSEDPADTCIDSIAGASINLKDREAKDQHSFTFDHVFDQSASQEEVYERVGSSVVSSAFDGVNGTIFCYGQTSSGKTHTCVGPSFEEKCEYGILPRLISETLGRIDSSPKNIEAKMKISMVEIYNEKIRDLLDQNKQDLKIRANKKDGIFIENVTEKYILTEDEAFKLLKTGLEHRSVTATNMNAQSSRSHMLFIFHLHTHDVYTRTAQSAKIILVDLAGSEKISKTGAEGKVLQEAKKINTSLTALGKVINCLSDGKSTHVPYRDSKLTRLLQESLGGNSLTNLIVNVSPSSYNQCETLTSIRFGNRAKAIKNQPTVNKSYTVPELLQLLQKAEKTIKQQHQMIQDLQKKKQRVGGYGSVVVPKMITMHLLPDDDEQLSQCSASEREIADQNEDQSRSSNSRKMHDPSISDGSANLQMTGEQFFCGEPRRNRGIKSQTLTNFHQAGFRKESEKKKSVCFDDYHVNRKKQPHNVVHQGASTKQAAHDDEFEVEERGSNCSIQPMENKNCNSQGFEQEVKVPKSILNLNIEAIPEDNKENIQSPRLFGQKLGIAHQVAVQENIDKIRQNLLEMKLLYVKEKRENSIKSMIIGRKNQVLSKVKKDFEVLSHSKAS